MATAIYTINNATELAFQKGTSRVVVSRSNSAKRHEVKENGEWRPARGYFKPNFIEVVKNAVRAA